MKNVKQNSAQKTVKWLILAVVLMFGFGYAMVPLYNVLCRAIGINGKTNVIADAKSTTIDTSRTITVQFVSTKNAYLNWKFYPMTKKVVVHPGESKQIDFFAQNDSGKEMTVQAIPSVSPGVAAKYLKKTECFCFNQQTLASGASMKMPMIFHLDPELPKNVHEITLSYTLFDAQGYKPVDKNKSGKVS